MKIFKTTKKDRVISITTVISIVVGFVIIFIGLTYYKHRVSELGITDHINYKKYKYHYAIISEESDAPFWEDIYEGALVAGKNQDAYVEKIGSNLSISYSLFDLMEIVIASKVDGIIVEPNGEEYMIDLINKAEEKGIPVITVLTDVLPSSRKSFVGINGYNQGQAFGKQVLEVIEEGRHKITVLLSPDSQETGQNIIYSSIMEAVKNKNVEVEVVTINTESTFSAEEDIRNIIIKTRDPSEVLVCLTEMDTLYAYRAVVDYNKVGDIDIIGYYDSDIILNAIVKNIIHSTMTIDAKLMGGYCVQALSEYRETSRVSDYFSVDITVINNRNISDFIDED